MTPPTTDGRLPAPNVLFVVMDCVRASDFPGGGPDPVRMPFVERLRPDCVAFPRAASVAPWTLPSHASMFTGLYPWEHGCHGRGHLTLDPSKECIASVLHAVGYRSISLSGNPIISPFYGLVNGFDVAHWGEWWEQVHRLKSTPSHSYDAGRDGHMPEVPVLSFRDRTGRAVKTMATRLPAPLALAESFARRTVDPDGRMVGNMNPWIEPTLARWLAAQPKERPVFSFVNLIDAHEPYLLAPGDAASLGDWWRCMRIPQDVLALLAGPVPPSRDELERLHQLYRNSIAEIDRRLEQLVGLFRDSGRWENTLMILTSDHGQAFGEHGMIWHGVRTDEEMLRVPLLVRLPHGELGGVSAPGWATPMDAAPTIFELAGIGTERPLSGVSFRILARSERPRTLLAAGDGTEWNRPFMEHLSPAKRTELNLFSIAAYRDGTKVVVDALSDAVRAYDLSKEPISELPTEEVARGPAQALVPEARRAATALLHPGSTGTTEEVDERLRSWGYG